MRYFMPIIKLFPLRLMEALQRIPINVIEQTEELRVRIGRAIVLRGSFGEMSTHETVSSADMHYLIGNATDCSYHTRIREIEKGYLSLQNGSRMGLCGRGSGANGVLRSVREIDSVCIRIAREQKGCADGIYPQLFSKGLHSCIVIGAPGAGKTSLLRELISRLSKDGVYIGVADERGEISGRGETDDCFDLGSRCDVIGGMPKCEAALMLLRTMSPNVVAMDEITAAEDLRAVEAIMKAGVNLIATVHGDALSVLEKPYFAPIHQKGVFEKAIIVTDHEGKRVYRVVDLDV